MCAYAPVHSTSQRKPYPVLRRHAALRRTLPCQPPRAVTTRGAVHCLPYALQMEYDLVLPYVETTQPGGLKWVGAGLKGGRGAGLEVRGSVQPTRCSAKGSWGMRG